MIEVLNKKKKRIGFIEGGKFYNKKYKLIGLLEGNIVKFSNANIYLELDAHNNIYVWKENVGFIYDSKIYFREKPIYEISKEKREIKTRKGRKVLTLRGNEEKIDQLQLFAIAIVFFESIWWKIIFT